MKKIETEGHLPYKKLFDALIGSNRLCFETVGADAEGRTILHRSRTVNMSSACGEESEYFFLTPEEVAVYARRANKNGFPDKKELKKYLSQAR